MSWTSLLTTVAAFRVSVITRGVANRKPLRARPVVVATAQGGTGRGKAKAMTGKAAKVNNQKP